MRTRNTNKCRTISLVYCKYKLGRTLGEGTFGKVKIGIHLIT